MAPALGSGGNASGAVVGGVGFGWKRLFVASFFICPFGVSVERQGLTDPFLLVFLGLRRRWDYCGPARERTNRREFVV